MAAELVNLRLARKRRARVEREAAAAENRVKFGQSAATKQAVAAEPLRALARHEGHRRDRNEADKP